MLLSSLTVLIAALPLTVFGGEFPSYDGVIGAVPPDVPVIQDFSQEVLESPAENVVTQAGSLRYVENSGVCGESPSESTASLYAHPRIETTADVYSASGYADLTSTQHMWFWFFAARNNPDTAPLTIRLNGGVSRFAYLDPAVKCSISQSREVLL